MELEKILRKKNYETLVTISEKSGIDKNVIVSDVVTLMFKLPPKAMTVINKHLDEFKRTVHWPSEDKEGNEETERTPINENMIISDVITLVFELPMKAVILIREYLSEFIERENKALLVEYEPKKIMRHRNNIQRIEAVILMVNESEKSYKVRELDVSNRCYLLLKRCGIHTIEKLCSYSKDELLLLNGMGVRSVDEITDSLAKVGRCLKNDNKNL